jgi:hypothetical protein
MANIIPDNNLQVSSQPWARELQKRLEELERNFNLQRINSNTVDSQLQSSYKRLDTAVKNIDTVYVDVDALTQISNNAVITASQAMIDISTLSSLVQSGPAPVPTEANSATGFGYIGVPQISTDTSITGTDTNWPSYAGQHIYTTVTGQTHTLPDNATIPLQIGTRIIFINAASVSTTIAIGGTDVLRLAGTATVGSRTLAAHGVATAIKITDTSWTIFGNALT